MDENTQKEVQELSEQYQATGRELSEVNAKLQGAMREQKATAITIGEVDQVTDETPLYRAVGESPVCACAKTSPPHATPATRSVLTPSRSPHLLRPQAKCSCSPGRTT